MKVTVKTKSGMLKIETQNKNILETLTENSIFINAYCGGRGLCRKCTIKYLNNPPSPCLIESQYFSDDELKNGIRLACMHELEDGNFIEVFESKPSFAKIDTNVCTDENKNYIALDIGTTTITMAFIRNGELIDAFNMLNPQIVFGADVMSRIAYSDKHSNKILSDVLNNSLKNTIDTLMNKNGIDKIDKMIVSANPVMLSFFFGFNPHSIGEYPYKPPFSGSFSAKWNGINAYSPPVISAFVGSDITAGLLNVDLANDFLFFDIGTNCEFVVKCKDKVFAASVPGGPALEGFGIDYGMMAQEGAIEKVFFDSTLQCSVIGNGKARGITGSGLISSIALLNKYGIMDKSGRMLNAWEIENIPLPLLNRIKKEGFLLENGVYLTQNSIREFQLVKGALRAGFEILRNKIQCDINKIEKIYISGGFTKRLLKDDIRDSNLLDIKGDFVSLGNSSINGSMKLFCRKNVEKIEEFAGRMEYIEIANEKQFQELYIKYMDFE